MGSKTGFTICFSIENGKWLDYVWNIFGNTTIKRHLSLCKGIHKCSWKILCWASCMTYLSPKEIMRAQNTSWSILSHVCFSFVLLLASFSVLWMGLWLFHGNYDYISMIFWHEMFQHWKGEETTSMWQRISISTMLQNILLIGRLIPFMGHSGSGSTVTGYRLDDSIRFLSGAGIFLFDTTYRPALGSTQPPVQLVPRALTNSLHWGDDRYSIKSQILCYWG